MIQIAGASLVILILSIVLKNYNRTYSIILSISGCVFIFLFVSDKISKLINNVFLLSQNVSGIYVYIKLMLKVLGVILITQFVSDLCRDNGENSLATMVETASKIVVITLVFPLFESIISFVIGLLK